MLPSLALAPALLLALLLAWGMTQTLEVLCVLFAGVVLGTFFAESDRAIADRAGLPRRVVLVGIVLALLVLVIALLLLAVPRIVSQFEQLIGELPRLVRDATTALETSVFGARAVEAAEDVLESAPALGDFGGLASNIAGVFSTGLGALTGLFLVLAIASYIAFEPSRYRNGLLAVVPRGQRQRTERVLDEAARVLSW